MRCLFIIYLLLTQYVLFGQNKYLPGVIITHEGEVIQGQVSAKDKGKTPSNIVFKKTGSDAPVNYLPTDIKGFKVGSTEYVAGIVDVIDRDYKTRGLDFEQDYQLRQDTAFLKVIVKGDKSLYFYADMYGYDNFFIDEGGQLKLLIYREYLKKIYREFNYDRVIAKNNQYIGQLRLYLNDCADIGMVLSDVQYSMSSIIDLFREYYKCISGTPESIPEALIPDRGVFFGPSITNCVFTPVVSSGFIQIIGNTDYSKVFSINGGLFYNVYGNTEKWSINNELFYTGYRVQGSYEKYENSEKYKKAESEISMHYIKYNFLFRKYLSSGKLKYFLNPGISVGRAFPGTNYLYIEDVYYTSTTITEGEALEKIKKIEVDYILGIGSKFKNTSIELRVSRGSGISPYFNLKDKVYKGYLLFSYFF